jgi:hypothetical protein
MEPRYKAVVSLIPIFQNKSFAQTSPNYLKVLLDNENQVLKKEVAILHKDLPNCLMSLFNEYIKINYEWPEKELLSCRKVKNIIEITYSVKMPSVNGSVKDGNLVNITEFSQLVSDKYYVECLTEYPRRFN